MKRIYMLLIVVVIGFILVGCNPKSNSFLGISEISIPYGGDQPIWFSTEVIGSEFEQKDYPVYFEMVNVFESGIIDLVINYKVENKPIDQLISVTIEDKIEGGPLLYFISNRYVILGLNDVVIPNYALCFDEESSCVVDEIENTVNYGVPGSYFIKYQAEDNDGNLSEIRTLYIDIIDNVETVLSYNTLQIGGLHETEEVLYYNLIIQQDIYLPFLEEPKPTRYLVSYTNNETKYLLLENSVYGEGGLLFVDDVITMYYFVNDEGNDIILKNVFDQLGNVTESLVIDISDDYIEYKLNENGDLYYIETDNVSINLYQFNESSGEFDQTVILVQDTETPYMPSIVKTIDNKIYLSGLVEKESSITSSQSEGDFPFGPNFFLTIYDMDLDDETTYLYSNGHISNVYDIYVGDIITILFEQSFEDTSESLFLSELRDGELVKLETVIDERDFGRVFMFDDENIMFYYEDSYECDNSNCTDTYIKYLGEEKVDLEGFFISDIVYTEYSKYIIGTYNGNHLFLKGYIE